jgi:hypothetical protein
MVTNSRLSDRKSGRSGIAFLRPIQLWSSEVYDAHRSAIANRSDEPVSAFRVLTMTPALERLAELVRQAEAKTRARKIEAEAQLAAEQFRAAELRARQAVEQFRQMRTTTVRAMEQADADEQLLKDLVRKLALYKSSLGSEADAERLIAASQAEIERTRQQSQTELAEINREVDESRRELRTATDQYRALRRELDRLQPDLAARFLAEDRLLWDAESHFPGGQLQLLGHEVDAGLQGFGSLAKLEQYARLKVWIGRFRFYQASQDREVEASEELQSLSHRVFHQLKWLSRQYEPGYIEAFRQDFSTDWASYVAEAQEQLAQAFESSRRTRNGEPAPRRDHELDELRPNSSGVHCAPRDDALGSVSRNLEHVQAVHDDARSLNDD